MIESIQNNNRKLYLDVLRIFAIFLVLFTHTGIEGAKLYTITENVILQIMYAMLDCFRTINNPLLFMISGALLLGKEENIDTIWRKRVIRFLVCLLLFSYIQAIWNYFYSSDEAIFDIWEIFKNLLVSPIRLQYWYLYSYISFLVMIPFLSGIAKQMDNSQFRYLLILAIVTIDLFPLASLKLGIAKINFSIFLNSYTTLYPLLGYYLDNHSDKLTKKQYILITVLTIWSIWFSAYMTIWNYRKFGNWEEKYITLFDTFVAVTVFFLVKKFILYLEQNRKLKYRIVQFIEFVSSTTFGIYLLENILEAFTRPIFILLSNYMPLIFACGIWLIATMFFGNIVVGLMKKVPGLKKLL